MTGKDALESYGFKEINGVYLRVVGTTYGLATERWKAVEGGFECYKADPSWGRPVEGGVYQMPFTTLNAQSGMHPATNPEAFVWVWPDEVVAFQYEHAGEGWVKTVDEAGVVSMTRAK